MAHELADAARATSRAGAEGNDFWYDSAERLLAPYLFAAAHTPGSSMADVVEWVTVHERDPSEGILDRLGCRAAAQQLDGIWKDDPKTLANIFSTTNLVIAACGDRRLVAAAD